MDIVENACCRAFTLTMETDEKTLENWLQHAAIVKSASDLFAASAPTPVEG